MHPHPPTASVCTETAGRPAENGASLPAPGVMGLDGLQHLIELLRGDGFQVLGPTRRAGAIVYGALTGTGDLPAGWTDVQGPGTYRLEPRDDGAVFGFTVGPHAWKRFLFPPRRRLWQADRTDDGGFRVTPDADDPPRMVFLGARACELAALAVQDRVFIDGPFADPVYAARRRNTRIVAVNCTQAAATCFCTSMQTGPRAHAGFDLALTELLDSGRHAFLVEAGTAEGTAWLARLPVREADDDDHAAAREAVERAAAAQQHTLDTEGLPDLLLARLDHPRWEAVADRCLACANCTMACPTCFCSSVEDTTDLTGRQAERWQQWDSCFTLDFSYIHGGSVRKSTRSRYRQWLTHKLAGWVEQFGTSGCVGCGRCIAWCPVGIDLREEVRALRGNASRRTRSVSSIQVRS